MDVACKFANKARTFGPSGGLIEEEVTDHTTCNNDAARDEMFKLEKLNMENPVA